MDDRPIPEATVGRLPIYLRTLVEMAENGVPTVSSESLAEATGFNSAKVRKDLSHLGSYGTRGVGYDVAYLIHQIRRELGLTQHWPVVIVGIGNLGHALANYRGFAERGFRAAALLDNDAAKVGEEVAGLRIRSLVRVGIRSILNFAPIALAVPEGISVRKVDLAVELQILTYYEQRKAALLDVKRPGRAALG